MKLGNATDTKVQGSEEFDSHDFQISSDQSAHIFRMLTSYSDPIASVVREITSNCFDSHERASVDRDVVVEMTRGSKLEGTDAEIRFKDFGVGLPPDEVKEIFTVLGESTKRETNAEMGAFGIGAKSPFGYIREKDLGGYTVDTWVDGTHWQYFLTEGQEGPQMTELLKESSDRTSGTTVTVPIADGDFYSFKRALRSELAYFDNITFEVNSVSSDYTIYRGENFIYRPDESPYDEVHACFGKVAYPLDFDILDWDTGGRYSTSKVNAPVGLLFDIGEIQVVPNRENINYTDKTIQAIDNKLDAARKEFQEMWDNAHKGIKSIEDLINARQSKSDTMIFINEDVSVPYCDQLLPDNSIKMDKFSVQPPRDIFYNYDIYKSVDEDGYVNSNAKTPNFNDCIGAYSDQTYLVETKYSSKKNRYIASRFGEGHIRNFYLAKKRMHDSAKPKYVIDDPAEDDWDKDDADDPFSRSKPPLDNCEKPELHKTRGRYDRNWKFRNDGRPEYDEITESQLKEVQEFESMVDKYVEDELKDYSEYEPSEDFEEWEKKKKKQKQKNKEKKNENQFPIKIIEKSGSYDEDYKWKMDDMKYDNLNDSTLYVYGFQKHSDDLLNLAPIIYSNDNFFSSGPRSYSTGTIKRQRVAVLKIAMKREYLFEDLDNAYHIDDFTDGHKVINRAFHAEYIKGVVGYSSRDSGYKLLKFLYPKIDDLRKEMLNFANKYRGIINPFDQDRYGVDVDDKTIKNWKYSEDQIKLIDAADEAIKDQLPLIEGSKISFNDEDVMDEFKVYMKAKNLIHPRLWCKREGIIE